jgi:hypothetical protein
MLKKGDMKVPLEKIGPLAKSLQVDALLLFWLCMTEYANETMKALMLAVPGIVLAPHERAVVAAYRELVGNDSEKLVTISDVALSVRFGGRE